MLDAVPAHVEFVQGHHILGEVVPDGVVDPELPVDGLQGGQQVGDLDIELLPPLFTDEVDLLVPGLAHGDGVAPAQQLQIDDVLQDQVDVPHIASVDSLPDAVVSDVVFLVGGEDLLALEVLPLDLEQEVCVGAEPQVVQNGFCGNGALFVAEELDQRAGGEGGAHIGHHIGDDPLQQIHIPHLVPLDDILELDGVEEVGQILAAGGILVAQVGEIRHTAAEQILLEAPGVRGLRLDGAVQLHELPEGEGVDHELHIPPAQIGGQLAGQQLGVGTGDVDVAVQCHPEGVDAPLPSGNLLDLVEEQIDLAIHLTGLLHHMIVQCLGVQQMPIAHILKIDGNEICRINPGLHQLFLHQLQHDRLAASANAGHDLDQLAADEGPNSAHILFPFDHRYHSLWLSGFSISQLKLKFNAKYVEL